MNQERERERERHPVYLCEGDDQEIILGVVDIERSDCGYRLQSPVNYPLEDVSGKEEEEKKYGDENRQRSHPRHE